MAPTPPTPAAPRRTRATARTCALTAAAVSRSTCRGREQPTASPTPPPIRRPATRSRASQSSASAALSSPATRASNLTSARSEADLSEPHEEYAPPLKRTPPRRAGLRPLRRLPRGRAAHDGAEAQHWRLGSDHQAKAENQTEARRAASEARAAQSAHARGAVPSVEGQRQQLAGRGQ